MSFPNYSQPQGNYSTPVPGAPPGPYSGQVPGAPPNAYPGQVYGAPPSTYPGQVPAATATRFPVYQQTSTTAGFQSQVGGYPSANPAIDPTIASWFRAVDQDNSGQVNAAELRLALQNGNWSQFSEEACSLMISMFDKNHTGTIDVQEFIQLFSFINQWTETYRRYDRDNSGTINENELNTALQQMGYRLSPQFVGLIVTKFSPRARAITLDNFILINIKIRNLTESFKSRDREMKGVVTISYEDFLNMAFTSL